MRCFRPAVVGVLLGIALAACGGDDTADTDVPDSTSTSTDGVDSGVNGDDAAPPEPDLSAETGPPVDVCGLLGADDVERVMGAGAVAQPEEPSDPFYGCRWETDAAGDLTVDIISWGDTDAARSSFDFFLGDVTEVDGIGDAALYNELTDLAFIVDGYEISIDLLTDMGVEAEREAAQELARLLIPGLP